MLFILLVFFIFFSTPVLTSRNVNYDYQLYEDLMYFYNKNVRPVKNSTQPLDVKFGASLIRIIDVVGFFKFFLVN
uniref:Neurotransmitter-gated ion-channel ligand-binding domain-containing protein n=1 Tax=Meloidogyne incognita TaxID=6306 RepID=A0A914MJN6_MELIC